MRLIIVPQYPTELRYQEWWFEEFPNNFDDLFEEVVVLGAHYLVTTGAQGIDRKGFAPVRTSINFEMAQIESYLSMELREDDILLLNDISFPGLFANVLFHKRPFKCFAICHATSINAYDYFEGVRNSKFPVETGIAELFDKIIVGSKYHKEKLGWPNVVVHALPEPALQVPKAIKIKHELVSVARKVPQKRNTALESFISDLTGFKIEEPNSHTWMEYYAFLAHSRIMLITSKEETFGYQIIDAIMAGCIPIAPNAFSYPELLPREYLYDSVEELVTRIRQAQDGILLPLNGSKVHQESQSFYKTLAYLMT